MSTTAFPRPAVLFFDVNETLLNLDPLKASIGAVLPGSDGLQLWFSTMLHYSLVMTVAGRKALLPEIGVAALRMLAQGRGITLSQQDAEAAVRPISRLPAHPDVAPALDRLRQTGLKMAALSNSSTTGLRAQLAYAGIARYFDAQFSVQDVGLYKPHPTVYQYAARQMRVEPGQAMLVAAHGWDVAGAGWAGLRTAFVRRPGMAPFPLAAPPDLVVSGLEELARCLGA